MTPVKCRIRPWHTCGNLVWSVVVPFRGHFWAWTYRDAVKFSVQMYEITALEQLFSKPDLRSSEGLPVWK